jgi:signal transduction histidine kinase
MATHVSIVLTKEGANIILIIKDNGRGCNPAEKKSGVGIRNIKSRAELFDGSVTIVSSPGNGYNLKVIFTDQSIQ